MADLESGCPPDGSKKNKVEDQPDTVEGHPKLGESAESCDFFRSGNVNRSESVYRGVSCP